MKSSSATAIVVFLIIFFVAACGVPPYAIMSKGFTQNPSWVQEDDAEYQQIKPKLQPSNKVFSIIWPVLYGLTALSVDINTNLSIL